MSDYQPEDWVDFTNMIDWMKDDLEEEEYDAFQKAADFIKKTLNIQTGENYVKSPLTGNYYKVNVWVDRGVKDDKVLMEAVSRREITEKEYNEGIAKLKAKRQRPDDMEVQE